MLWADRESKLGQIGDITPPVPQKKLEELRNAGMV
ncbi:phage tail protein, partial [Ochrobactrum sp. MR28]|nr:phage tail protein [Ochrobactrum sp. MR28]MBX8819065.1 phage tail protein [Ochrobactrum sp. MR31]